MDHPTQRTEPISPGEFIVPGTCVAPRIALAGHEPRGDRPTARNPQARDLYLAAALADIPRLLGAIDRNPYRATYGCLDRQFWHYRTAAFPSGMYQEGALPLALAYTLKHPENRWYRQPRVRELAIAAIRFAARSSRRDGSCDDYYPFERALGAAVFSLAAAAEAYRLLELDDAELLAFLRRRADWVMRHDESGRLANHQAMAALGLLRVAEISGHRQYRDAAAARLERLLAWQSDEGWFDEYGGADPGYQTVTIDCLAKIRCLTADARLDEPLRKAVSFTRLFLHPDGSFGGEYGSRGTYHFYPHGMELLAAENAEAAELADGFLRGLAAGRQAALSDDRMFIHRLGNLLEAYRDYAPTRPAAAAPRDAQPLRYFPHARMLVRRTGAVHTVISAARGGVLKHFTRLGPAVTDAGLIVECAGGRVAVSQMHDLERCVEFTPGDALQGAVLSVAGPLCWCRFETATPLKQALFHVGMAAAGRWCRTLVRRLLQRRLITGRRPCPIRLRRVFEFLPEREALGGPGLRIIDTIELCDPRLRVRRMGYGTDHQAAYVAASGAYQDGVLQPWTDLAGYVEAINAGRHVTVVREI